MTIPSRVVNLPHGEAGTERTVDEMCRLVRSSLSDPLVVDAARRVVAACPPRNDVCRANAIRRWLAANFQFERDPVGVELVMTPRLMLDRIAQGRVVQGDCDDAATLGAAIGMAVGLRARFVLLGFGPKRGDRIPLTHIYTALNVMVPLGGRRWVQLDVTKPEGAQPPTRVTWKEI